MPFSGPLILFEQWARHRLLSEKVIRPHVRADRPILIPSVPVSDGIEIRHGCHLSVAWYVLLPSCPVVLAGSCLVGLALICRGQGILDGISVLMGSTSRTWESCHHQCLKAVCDVLGCSALELLDGTLKLRHLSDGHSDVGKRVRLARKTRPGASSHSNPDPGHPTPTRWKRLRPPFLRRSGGGEVGVPRNLFPRLGVG